MDSEEARRNKNGQHSPFHIIEYAHIQRKGEVAEMTIIGDEQNIPCIEKLLKETIIPTLTARCGLAKGSLTIKGAEVNPDSWQKK